MSDLIRVIHLMGVQEHLGPGVSAEFVRGLDDRFQAVIAAGDRVLSYGIPTSFAESARYARDRVVEQIVLSPGPVVLSGYSGGALIQGDLANDIAFGQVADVDPGKILAVALLADPKRPEHCGAPGIPTPHGYGIAGQRPVNSTPVFWGSASNDAITACGPYNPLRTVADLSTLWSLDPLKAGGWALDVLIKLQRRQLQPWWMHPFSPARDFSEAITALWGYCRTAHTIDYLDQGICTSLAQAVNRGVS